MQFGDFGLFDLQFLPLSSHLAKRATRVGSHPSKAV